MAGVIGVSGSQLPMVDSADDGGVALGDHPRRTVVYGGALIIAAMVGATFVWQAALPGWLTATLLALTLAMALVGWVMTFRDLTPSRRRRRR